jgi:5-aminopentanamidase
MALWTKVAGMQIAPVIGETAQNLARCQELLQVGAAAGARLILFPEATLSGYMYRSLEEALPITEPIPGPSTDALAASCRALNVYTVVGLLEKDGPNCYNAAAFIGPSGLIGKYRKLHLPYLGVDRFVKQGDLPLEVYDTELGRIGLSICYDLDFPEQSRVLMLLGAEIIVTITNWPEGVQHVPEFVIRTRARENAVHHVAVNRVGNERAATFFGKSRFVDCAGEVLADGKAYEEDIIYAGVDPSRSREKREVLVPGELEIDRIRDRRPEFYGLLAE